MIHTPAHRDHRIIYDLSLEFMDPPSSERAMRKSMQSKLNLQEKILLKDQMMCLKDIGTNEIQSMAIKVSKKIRHNKESVIKRIVKYMMKIKVEDVKKDIEEARKRSSEDQESLDEIVRPKTVVAHEYRQYLKNE